MTIAAEVIVTEHPGLDAKSDEAVCAFDQFHQISTGGNCVQILDGTMRADGGHPLENDFIVYRACGRNACRAELGMAISDNGEIHDAKGFGASCTGKL